MYFNRCRFDPKKPSFRIRCWYELSSYERARWRKVTKINECSSSEGIWFNRQKENVGRTRKDKTERRNDADAEKTSWRAKKEILQIHGREWSEGSGKTYSRRLNARAKRKHLWRYRRPKWKAKTSRLVWSRSSIVLWHASQASQGLLRSEFNGYPNDGYLWLFYRIFKPFFSWFFDQNLIRKYWISCITLRQEFGWNYLKWNLVKFYLPRFKHNFKSVAGGRIP